MRVLIAGASGLIGTEVTREFAQHGHEVRTLVRRPARTDHEWRWEPEVSRVPAEAIAWADAVIALSGASLGRLPWTRAYKRTILSSRTRATGALADAIRASDDPPAVWVNASASGIYGDRPGETLTESSSNGSGFLAGVVARWEEEARADDRTRVVTARTGIVLARGGALRPLILATRLGLGATVGCGKQHWPWISLRDEARAIVHLAMMEAVTGPVNLTGPTPATAGEVTRALARAFRRPHLLRLPAWALRLAMGSAADDLLLADQRVSPTVLAASGFEFEHPTVDAAADAVRRPARAPTG